MPVRCEDGPFPSQSQREVRYANNARTDRQSPAVGGDLLADVRRKWRHTGRGTHPRGHSLVDARGRMSRVGPRVRHDRRRGSGRRIDLQRQAGHRWQPGYLLLSARRFGANPTRWCRDNSTRRIGSRHRTPGGRPGARDAGDRRAFGGPRQRRRLRTQECGRVVLVRRQS